MISALKIAIKSTASKYLGFQLMENMKDLKREAT